MPGRIAAASNIKSIVNDSFDEIFPAEFPTLWLIPPTFHDSFQLKFAGYHNSNCSAWKQ